MDDRNIMENLRTSYSKGVRFFDTYIPLSAKIPESDVARMSIYNRKLPGRYITDVACHLP